MNKYYHIAVFNDARAAKLAARRGGLKDVLKPATLVVEDDAVILSTTEKVPLDTRLEASSEAQRAIGFCSFRFNQLDCPACGFLSPKLYHVGAEPGRDMCMDCIRAAVAMAAPAPQLPTTEPLRHVAGTAPVADLDCGLGITVLLPAEMMAAIDEKILKRLADTLADQVLYHILPTLLNEE